MHDEHERLGFKIKTISKLMAQNMTKRITSLDLTSSQAFILGYLCHQQDAPVCSKDIERQFGFSHPTVSGLLQRLGSKGFIICEPSPEDRRFNRILVTEKARQIDREIHKQIDSTEQILVGGMTEEEVAQLKDFLDRMIANITPISEEGGTCP